MSKKSIRPGTNDNGYRGQCNQCKPFYKQRDRVRRTFSHTHSTHHTLHSHIFNVPNNKEPLQYHLTSPMHICVAYFCRWPNNCSFHFVNTIIIYMLMLNIVERRNILYIFYNLYYPKSYYLHAVCILFAATIFGIFNGKQSINSLFVHRQGRKRARTW